MAHQAAAPGPESLRLSVFQVAADSGLVNPRALDGFFDSIQEEDEEGSLQPQSTVNSQRNTTSSENSSNYVYPLTPPQSSTTTSPQLRLNTHVRFGEPRARFVEELEPPVAAFEPAAPVPILATATPKKQPAKIRKLPSQADILLPHPQIAPSSPDHETSNDNFLLRGLKGKKEKSSKAKEEKAREKQEKQSQKEEKEREEKASKEHQRERGRSISAKGDDDDDRKRGFFGFRMKSKERKAAGKESVTPITELPPMPLPAFPPPPLPAQFSTGPQEPLPIADLYRRQQEEISFRPPPKEDPLKPTEDGQPRLREQFTRPHPPWRSEPSGSPHVKRFQKLADVDEAPPQEVHVLPPGQESIPRPEPPKHILEDAIQELLKEVDELPDQPRIVNSVVIDEYYGIQPGKKPERPPMLQIPDNEQTVPKALQDALFVPPQMAPTPLTPSLYPSEPLGSQSYIVPSPNPSQVSFTRTEPEVKEQTVTRKPSAKRNGVRFAIPPPLGSPLLPPRRPTGAYNPPPTPPPTTDLPPLPSTYPSEQEFLPSSAMGSRAGTPVDRPSTAQGMTEPLRLKVNTGGIQRGKMSPFPTRPITPVTRAESSTPIPGQRRIGLPSNPRERLGAASPDDLDVIARVHAPFVNLGDSPPPSAPVQRNRSKRMGTTGGANSNNFSSIPRYLQQQEPDSDDDTASRYSVDTYYKRTTMYEKESAYGDVDVDESTWDELRARRFAQIEAERTAGRERLVRLLVDDNA